MADARRGASRATRPLVGRSPADGFDEQCSNAPFGIEPGDTRHTAIDHMTNAVDGD